MARNVIYLRHCVNLIVRGVGMALSGYMTSAVAGGGVCNCNASLRIASLEMGESGLHMSWDSTWGYLLSLPAGLQNEMGKVLDYELSTWLAFRSREVQIEVLSRAPQPLIDSLARRKVRYSKPGNGVGYLQIIKPDVLEYLNESRHNIKAEPKRKRKGCHKHG